MQPKLLHTAIKISNIYVKKTTVLNTLVTMPKPAYEAYHIFTCKFPISHNRIAQFALFADIVITRRIRKFTYEI